MATIGAIIVREHWHRERVIRKYNILTCSSCQKHTKNQFTWALHGSAAVKITPKKQRSRPNFLSIMSLLSISTQFTQNTDYRTGFSEHPAVWRPILWMIKIPMSVSLTDSSPRSGNLFTEKETSLVIPKHICLIQMVRYHHDCFSKAVWKWCT